MSRRYKIRRNQKIYSGSSRRQRWKVAGFVGILLVVFLLGWSLYQPIYNFGHRPDHCRSQQLRHR